jgi:hypothetical protein
MLPVRHGAVRERSLKIAEGAGNFRLFDLLPLY